MNKFRFEMNDYGNILYVFNGSREMPVDTLSFAESNEGGRDTMVRGWVSQSCDVQKLHCRLAATLEETKEFYNENYEEILQTLFPEQLLKIPVTISGFYLNSNTNTIERTTDVEGDKRAGVACTHDEAVGMVAFSELSQLLRLFNLGWKPNWSKDDEKWCIQNVRGKATVTRVFFTAALLAFETEKKANFFLKERAQLIANLSNAGII
jgi:hypothetical protein